MFASPALCHFRKTRSQCLLGRTENNHGTDRWFPNRHETQYVQNVVRRIKVQLFANHIIICETEFFLSLPLPPCSHTTHLPPPTSHSRCTLLPSIPPAATVHSVTCGAGRCWGPHGGYPERVRSADSGVAT